MKTFPVHVSPKMLASLSLLLWILCLPRQTSSVPPRDKRCYNANRRYSVDNSSCPDFKLCKCSDTVLDCSFALKTMSDPQIPFLGRASRFQVLNISNNGLTNLSDAHTFLRVSENVLVLDLYNNNMLAVAPDLFEMLVKLNRLLIGGNKLDYKQLSAVTRAPKLRYLEVRCGNLGDIPDYFFTNSLSSLIDIDLSWNRMKTLDMRVFRSQRLQVLSVTNNKLLDFTSDYSPSLQRLDLHKNRLSKFPQTCSEDGESLFPNLTNLVLLFNDIESIPDRVCLPSLKRLNLKFNKIEFFVTNMFSTQKFPSLRSLILFEQSIKIRQMHKYTFNNSHLQNLEFGNLNVNLSDPAYVDAEVFYGCPNVTRLLLLRNDMKAVTRERFHVLFQEFYKMEIFLAGYTQLQLEDNTTFDIMPNLKRLELYRNELVSIPPGSFDRLTKLENLTLNSNFLNDIPKNTFSEETLRRLTTIDLSGNQFVCDCSVQPVKRWMQSYPGKFVKYRNLDYRCLDLNNTTRRIQDFALPDQACLLSPLTSVVICSCCLFVVGFLVISIILYPYYYRLSYILRYTFLKRHRGLAQAAVQFKYDVYIAFEENDEHWVRKNLIPMVEGQWGQKLCIPSIEFAPGRSDIANTDEAVLRSRSYLLVFSKNFAESRWCNFELSLIMTNWLVTNKICVAVILPTLTEDHLGRHETMGAVLQTGLVTSLEWQRGKKSKFWSSLRDALLKKEN